MSPPPTSTYAAPILTPGMLSRVAVLSGGRCFTGIDYGPLRKGKTTNLVRTWAGVRFLVFGDPTPVLQAADTWTGAAPIVPKRPVRNLRDATAYLNAVADKKAAGKAVEIKAAGFDDFSLACDEEYVMICEEIRGKNHYDRVNALRDAILDYRRAARRAEIHLHHNAHLAEPIFSSAGKVVLPGGPRMPIKTTRDWIPVIATTICYVTSDPKRAGDFKVSAYCDPSDQLYIHGDRYHTAPLRGPLNTGEFLRAAGLLIPRIPALEDIGAEAVVEKMAQRLNEGVPRPEVAGKAFEWLAKRLDDIRHIEWVLQDGCDRAEIRRSIAHRRLGRFFAPEAAEAEEVDDGLEADDNDGSRDAALARVSASRAGKKPEEDDLDDNPRTPRPGAGAAPSTDEL